MVESQIQGNMELRLNGLRGQLHLHTRPLHIEIKNRAELLWHYAPVMLFAHQKVEALYITIYWIQTLRR
jgi:hypothetical protein